MNRAALEEGDCSLLGFGGNGRHFPAFRLSPKYESRQSESRRGSLHSRLPAFDLRKLAQRPELQKLLVLGPIRYLLWAWRNLIDRIAIVVRYPDACPVKADTYRAVFDRDCA
jgi:hypothetical protein